MVPKKIRLFLDDKIFHAATYFVLKALEGEADSNQAKKITVLEMAPYLKTKVEKVTGGIQRPIAVNYGRDVVMTKR